MATRRIVQCFGTKIRPHKKTQQCRRKYLWTAIGSSAGNFGRKGAQACPHCGTIPNFKHPINKYLNGDLSEEQAKAILKNDYNLDWTKKKDINT